MNYTNKHNLPVALVSALSTDNRAIEKGIISVTSLIGSPRKRVLLMRHGNEVEGDVSDNLWSLLGKAVHAVMEGHGEGTHEQEIEVDFQGAKVIGHYDHKDIDHNIRDYKVTSAHSFILGDKPEWEGQLNSYAWLDRKNGKRVDGLYIDAILRDWMRSKAKIDKDYPQCPFVSVKIPLWDEDDANGFVAERVKLHLAAEAMDDKDLPDCTAQERWERPTVYAVMKDGRKSALKLFDDEVSAQAFSALNAGSRVVTRSGESAMCSEYCPVRNICNLQITHCGGF